MASYSMHVVQLNLIFVQDTFNNYQNTYSVKWRHVPSTNKNRINNNVYNKL